MTETDRTAIAEIVKRLTALLETENDQIGRMNIAQVRQLQENKLNLLQSYESLVNDLESSGQASIQRLLDDPALVVKIRRLRDVVVMNQRRIAAAKEALDRALACIVEAVRSQGLRLTAGAATPAVLVDRQY